MRDKQVLALIYLPYIYPYSAIIKSVINYRNTLTTLFTKGEAHCRNIALHPSSILVTLYNSLVLPHFNYCLLIWGACSNVGKLSDLQKMIPRTVICSGYIAHTDPIFLKL